LNVEQERFLSERRLEAFKQLPWPIPASVLVQMTDEDLDRLYAAGVSETPEYGAYWSVLNAIVCRITGAA
jgi:hypothetical protein